MQPIIGVILISLLVGVFGKDRRFGFWGYFFLSLLLTPLGGFLILQLTGPATEPRQLEQNGRPRRGQRA